MDSKVQWESAQTVLAQAANALEQHVILIEMISNNLIALEERIRELESQDIVQRMNNGELD